MTDIDRDAIKARRKRYETTPYPNWQPTAFVQAVTDTAGDVPALLARLAEVEAERDARDEWARDVAVFHGMTRQDADDDRYAVIAKCIKNLADENARLRQELAEAREVMKMDNNALAQVVVERGLLRVQVERLKAAADDWARAKRWYELRAELDAMRPVAEAAAAWRDLMATGDDLHPAEVYDGAEIQLGAAVDAYRAAQNRPASPPESTLGDEQAEPAVASTNTAQAQEGVQGDWEPSEETWRVGDGCLRCNAWPRDVLATVCAECGAPFPVKPYQPAPADPPGLDAAIEDALAEWLRRTGLADSPRGHCTALLRAAAPALRAGALRDGADWIRAEAEAEAKRLNVTDPKAASDAINNWLCGIRLGAKLLDERADRIGGAT